VRVCGGGGLGVNPTTRTVPQQPPQITWVNPLLMLLKG